MSLRQPKVRFQICKTVLQMSLRRLWINIKWCLHCLVAFGLMVCWAVSTFFTFLLRMGHFSINGCNEASSELIILSLSFYDCDYQRMLLVLRLLPVKFSETKNQNAIWYQQDRIQKPIESKFTFFCVCRVQSSNGLECEYGAYCVSLECQQSSLGPSIRKNLQGI